MDNSNIRKEVEERFNRDFNLIPLLLLEKAYPDCQLLESILYPDNFDENEDDEPLYPMWNYLFEAKDEFLSDILKKRVNELAEIGIYLMEVEETNAMMFVRGAGYDFYKSHWTPLYTKVLKWV